MKCRHIDVILTMTPLHNLIAMPTPFSLSICTSVHDPITILPINLPVASLPNPCPEIPPYVDDAESDTDHSRLIEGPTTVPGLGGQYR